MAKKVEVDISIIPEKQLKLTQAWMDAYIAQADVDKLVDYQKKLEEAGKPKFNERRKIFVDVFGIKFPKKEKQPEQEHLDYVKELIKKKKAAAEQ